MSKRIAIHQPETFPYPGFFNKMLEADEFIILDNVQFKKNNYQNRNRILHCGNPKWLTFPVDMKGRLESTIKDTLLANTVDWRARNIKVLEDAYEDSFYFEHHMWILRRLIEYSSDNLMHFNMSIIEYMRHVLDITTPLIYSSTLNTSSHKSDLVFDICKERGATEYLSGKGGRDYLDLSKFDEAGIKVLYQEFYEEDSYSQTNTEVFVPYMSTIDALMNNSENTVRGYIQNAFDFII